MENALSITLHNDRENPIVLTPQPEQLIAECRGPDGASGSAASQLIAQAVCDKKYGPPLRVCVVPGDRVAIALPEAIPQREFVLDAVRDVLEKAGVNSSDIVVVDTPPEQDKDAAYLAADESGEPNYLSRVLVDADVVILVSTCQLDASLGGRSLSGELWPFFSRPERREQFVLDLAKKGRGALAHWNGEIQKIDWNLGLIASLRLVIGSNETLSSAVFGLPRATCKIAYQRCEGWRPSVNRKAALTVTSVSSNMMTTGSSQWDAVIRAIAAAGRVTCDDGTICLVGSLSEEPGEVLTQWRQGALLRGIVHEAIHSNNQNLIKDALQTRLLAKALGDRRLVIFSDLEESLVEDLEFGFAESPDDLVRLTARADELIVLHEGDLLMPQIP
ncbi:MAG: hypothetical protein ABGW78_09935 [Pirellulales bacterium]